MSALELVRAPALTHDVERYMSHKRKRLTEKSELSYRRYLKEFGVYYPTLTLDELNPPRGGILIEDFLNARYGHLAPRTYNKAFSVLRDFVKYHVDRELLTRDPMAMLERATPRAVHRRRFNEAEWLRIFAANPEPHDQIALHLLLDYGLRKGALQNVRFEHFDEELRRLTIFTKGQKIFQIDIPDGRIWRLIAQLDEPGNHYLLCKQKMRRRTPPQKRNLIAAAWLTDELAAMLARVTDDNARRELEQTVPALEHLVHWVGLAAAAARVQVRRVPVEPIGEHGAHLWWYRCLARAGVVDPGVTKGRKMHSARYTAGQRLLDETGNLKEVQTLLCHANISTTGDIYVDVDSKKVGQSMSTYLGRGEDDLALELQERASKRTSR